MKKKHIIILLALLTASLEGSAQFITTWNSANEGGSTDTQITIPIYEQMFEKNPNIDSKNQKPPEVLYNYDVYWEEVGNPGHHGDSLGATDAITLEFGSVGIYRVEITEAIPGGFPRIFFYGADDAAKLLTIEQWGDNAWTSMESAFSGCTNLTTSSGVPDLSNVTSMSYMFSNVSAFNGDLSGWEVTSVEDMSYMFSFAFAFNGDLSGWDVSSVESMSYMFSYAFAFNGDLSGWDVSSVESMFYTFSYASAFNGDLSGWDVSNVTDMSGMFYDAFAFNGDLSDWDVSSVTDMDYMFSFAPSFNGDLSSWEVSSVENMEWMFSFASSFNGDLSSWEVSNVENMEWMFYQTSSFNGDLSSWDINNVTNMSGMLDYSGITPVTYDAILQGWNDNGVQENVTLGAAGLTYCAGETARTNLINPENAGWDIVGDILNCTQTITFDPLPDKVTTDASFALTASASSGLPVSYESSDEEVATISDNNIVTIIGVGTTTITASRLVSGAYEAADNVDQDLEVKLPQTITFDALHYKALQDPDFDLTASASSGLPVSYYIEDFTNFETPLDPGFITGGAAVPFVSTNQAYTGTQSLQMGSIDHGQTSSITIDIDLSTNGLVSFWHKIGSEGGFDYGRFYIDGVQQGAWSGYDDWVEETYALSAGLHTLKWEYSKDGSVSVYGDTWWIDDLTIPGESSSVATLSGSTVSIAGLGTTTIVATQAGDATYGPATAVAQDLTVVSQIITFDALADKTYDDVDFGLTATASSGLAVSYSSSDTNVATIEGSTVTIVGVGTTTITASQSGDGNYNAATDVVQDLTVNKAAQTITFDALANKLTTDADFDLTATSSSGLAVSYSSSDEAVATVSGSTVTIVGAGTTTITASQTGDDNYNAATDVAQDLTVKVAQTITFDALEDQIFEAGTIKLGATASSELEVSYEITSGPATVTDNEVSFTDLGAVTIRALQAGNDTFSAATAVAHTFEVITVTGVEIAELVTTISFYPNPSESYITVQSKDKIAQVEVLDMSGKQMTIQQNGQQLDISTLQAGNYLLKVTTANEVSVNQFIKQ